MAGLHESKPPGDHRPNPIRSAAEPTAAERERIVKRFSQLIGNAGSASGTGPNAIEAAANRLAFEIEDRSKVR